MFDLLVGLKLLSSHILRISISLDAIARTDVDKNRNIYPSKYELVLNNESSAIVNFTLADYATTLDMWSKEAQLILASYFGANVILLELTFICVAKIHA